MIYCEKHQDKGAPIAASSHSCQNCVTGSASSVDKLCDTCGLEYDLCQKCALPAKSGRSRWMSWKIDFYRTLCHITWARADSAYAKQIAPFKMQASQFESQLDAACAECEAATMGFRQTLESFRAKLTEAQRSGVGMEEATKAYQQALADYAVKSQPFVDKRESRLKEVNETFTAYRNSYNAARAEMNAKKNAASQRLEDKVTYLGATFLAKQRLKQSRGR